MEKTSFNKSIIYIKTIRLNLVKNTSIMYIVTTDKGVNIYTPILVKHKISTNMYKNYTRTKIFNGH